MLMLSELVVPNNVEAKRIRFDAKPKIIFVPASPPDPAQLAIWGKFGR